MGKLGPLETVIILSLIFIAFLRIRKYFINRKAQADGFKKPMPEKPSSFGFYILIIAIVVALITNPGRETINAEIKAKFFREAQPEPATTVFEQLGYEMGMSVIENSVDIDNYLVFSVVKMNYNGKGGVIGYAAFGNVWFTVDN